jgi:hypothetical protein
MSIYNVVSALGGVKPSSYSFPDSQFQSAYGSGVYSQPLTVRDYFTEGQLPNGATFIVTGKILDTGWGYNSPYSWTLTYGTDTTTGTTPYAYRKQFYMRAVFSSGIVQMYGFYSGDSTSSPNGRVTISAIALT